MTIIVPLEMFWFVLGAFTMLCGLLLLGWWANRRIVRAEQATQKPAPSALDESTLQAVGALGKRLATEELKAIERS